MYLTLGRWCVALNGPDTDLEWKLIYVGSAESEEYDQELDSCMVGPVPVGMWKLVG